MNRLPVKSSNIAAIGYDSASRKMEVEFTTGAVYEYSNVSPSTVRAFRKAKSIGRYFSKHIKSNFDGRKL